ncbi:MAG: sugar phosphate isomerase/epimerase, partial [Nanoarchaeota archaeon]|nr:sugar phosphate isomerase/epimerase [Nanoarchaeota archaeon]
MVAKKEKDHLQGKMKYLIDPTYVTRCPLSVLPDSFAYLTGWDFFKKWNIVERLNKKAFKKFDGIDFNFCLAGLMEKDGITINEKKVEKIKNKNWKIYAFHGSHEDLRGQFKYMELNFAEDSYDSRMKILSQLKVVKELSTEPNPIIVYHAGTVKNKPANIDSTLKNIEFAVKEAEERGIIIAIENAPRDVEGNYNIGSDYNDLKKILKKIDSPNLGICFDWGHANNYAGVYAKEKK